MHKQHSVFHVRIGTESVQVLRVPTGVVRLLGSLPDLETYAQVGHDGY